MVLQRLEFRSTTVSHIMNLIKNALHNNACCMRINARLPILFLNYHTSH